jgi:putative hydrolase of HD superfamily
MDKEVVHLLALARVALDFGKVNRTTYHADGVTPESDTDHTVMLGLVACAMAERMPYPLDVGLVAQYAYVHDLVEVYAGDTCTLDMPTPAGTADKAYRETLALRRLERTFGTVYPWITETIRKYEKRADPEAAFVKAVDKLLPKLTHLLNNCQSLRERDMTSDALAARYRAQTAEMVYADPWPEIMALRARLADKVALALRALEDGDG